MRAGRLPAVLKQMLETNTGLRSLVFHLPWAEGAGLRASTRQALPGLAEASASAALMVRLQVLLALHPRVGRCSLLQLLPLPLVRQVLDLAAPLQHLAIEVAAV